MPELRTSSYTIYVDLPDTSDQMLLVHGYTGAYDVVSRPVARWVRSLEPRRAPRPLFGVWSDEAPGEMVDIEPSDSTVTALQRRGYLTHLSRDQEHDFFRDVALKHHTAAQNRFAWVFMPTYDCNLRCSYCFQDHMRTDPRFSHLLRAMSPELIDRIFVAIGRLETEHEVVPDERRPRNIGLFGGEPLLACNRPLVEHIIRAGDGVPQSVWAISNATDLDAYEDLLGPEGIATIQVTIDGPPAEHDKRRIRADGSGSFEAIAANIEMALGRGTLIQTRMNIDRANIPHLPELASEFERRGWTSHPNFSAYTAPIHATNAKTDRATTFDPWQLDQALSELRLEHDEMAVINRPDDRLRRAAGRVFAYQAEPPLKAEYCGAHSGMYMFDALGDIYACWERTGDAKVRIGRISESGSAEMNTSIENAWRTRSVATVKACSHCRYALHCGGGCAVLAEGRRGKMDANYCDEFAHRFRAMVAEAYLDHQRGEVSICATAEFAAEF